MDETYITKRANRDFYDLAAPVYEKADGRRKNIPSWLEGIVKGLAIGKASERLLDLGAGSGWISNIGVRYFKEVYAYDISSGILNQIRNDKIIKIAGEAEKISLKDESINVVISFAVLHHIYNLEPVFEEVYRVLKPGGLFYSDHDIESNFVKRFIFFIKLYRKLSNPAKRYIKLNSQISKKLYDLTEFHSDGIDSNEVGNLLKRTGFKEIKTYYHWLGLSKITDVVFSRGMRAYSKTNAPLFSFIARK